jgi:4-diphosphocytidyl-2-C-methyl-D-erythritol kinase
MFGAMRSLPCGYWRAWLAPAKINLFLEVLGKRADGYHELVTLMAPIGLYDTLYFSPQQEGRLACRWATPEGPKRPASSHSLLDSQLDSNCGPASGHPLGDLPPEKENLVYRAVALLKERAGVEAGAAMRLVKRIPSAAGLGGASSDAATALFAANEGWGLHWPRSRLMDLAAELGSDLSFFLGRGPALCRGRGERIEPVAGLPRLHVVVARPPSGLSTARVYAHCRPAETPHSAERLITALQTGNLAAAGAALVNRLQAPAEQLSEDAARMARELNRLDVWGSQMSGSGSSYFALCRSARHARCVAARLRARNVGVVFAVATENQT